MRLCTADLRVCRIICLAQNLQMPPRTEFNKFSLGRQKITKIVARHFQSVKHSSNLEGDGARIGNTSLEAASDSHLESALLIVICKLGAQIVIQQMRNTNGTSILSAKT